MLAILIYFFCSLIVLGQINIDTAAFNRSVSEFNLTSNNSVVVLGEAHEVGNTLLTEYFIIEKLAAIGYKNIFIEGGNSEAEILNMYLRSGDSLLFNKTRARGSNGKYKEFISLLYKLNKNTGFTFYGNDFERAPCIIFLFKKWFAEATLNNPEIKPSIQMLLSIERRTEHFYELNDESKVIKSAFDSIKMNFNLLETEYKKILKENFPAFRSIIFNPSYYKNDADKKRDDFMLSNMLQFENKIGLTKAIVITGSGHIINRNSFIPLLMDKLNSKYDFSTFIAAYKNCMILTEKPFRFNSEKKLFKLIKSNQSTKPFITFSVINEKLIPAIKTKPLILMEFYNQ